jgi:signal transduction histidine kinase
MTHEQLHLLFRSRPDDNVSIIAQMEEGLFLEVDTSKVKRVFSNILSNAIHAMKGVGTVSISASVRRSRVVFRIRNSGSYIAPEVLPHLFEAFFTHNKLGGTGLGLAIARKWVEAHGGQIVCRSEKSVDHPDGWVEFEFDLPGGVTVDKLSRPRIPDHSSGYRMAAGLRFGDDQVKHSSLNAGPARELPVGKIVPLEI